MAFSISNFQFIQKNSCVSFTLSIPSFNINKGELVFVYGGSGSGKSTFFNLLAGTKKSSINNSVRSAFPKIEYVMHESKLLPWHKLKDNIHVINKLNGTIKNNSIIDVCKTFGLGSEILNIKSWQLSLGMRQRFEIAIALSNNPNLIIFDEALSGIDSQNKNVVCKAVYEYIKQNKVAFLATAHQISDILRLAERVVLLENGTFKDNVLITSHTVEDRLNMTLDQLYLLPEAKILMNCVN
jgi:ABC-type multidrug transport system ATPase subunit